jgi:hypothetical protein
VNRLRPLVVVLALGLSACASKGTALGPSLSPSPSPSPSASPTPAPSPSGCLDKAKALATLDTFRTQLIAFVTDRTTGQSSAAAGALKKAEATVRTVVVLVAADPALEAQAQALQADLILGAGTDPKKQKEESAAFYRIPLDNAQLATAIQQDTAVPSC